jgi:hypothetical protein
MYNLAHVYYEQGKYMQAQALYRQTLEIQRRVLRRVSSTLRHPA